MEYSERCYCAVKRSGAGVLAALALLPGLVCAAPQASALESARTPRLALHSFGTLGVVYSNEGDADFVRGFFTPDGAGHTNALTPVVDSKLGVQADARLGERLSAVVQLVAQQQYDDRFEPRVEWANLKYQFTPDFSVRVGRTVTMPFLVSDSRQVGFGNLWLRPPQEVYGLIPLTNKDGIDTQYRFSIGEVTNSLHLSFGEAAPRLPNDGEVKAKRYVDASGMIEYGPFAFRASYSGGEVDLRTPDLDALLDGFREYGNFVSSIPGLENAGRSALALANEYDFEDADISVVALGASYDHRNWLLMAEWARFRGHSFLADSSAWYATAGYRMGQFTPYLTLARLDADAADEQGIPLDGLPPLAIDFTQQLNDGLRMAIDSTAFAQRSIALGVRWDMTSNVALKAQYDYIDLDSGSSGRLGNVQPDFRPGGSVGVFGITLDFAF